MEPLLSKKSVEKLAESLESGEVLTYLVEEFLKNPSEDLAISMFWFLRDSDVWVPMTGEEPVPDILESESGNNYYPVFSQTEKIPEGYLELVAPTKMAFKDCMKYVKENNLDGIVVNPFTESLPIDLNILATIEELPEEVPMDQDIHLNKNSP